MNLEEMSTGKYHEPRASERLDVSDEGWTEKTAHSGTSGGGRNENEQALQELRDTSRHQTEECTEQKKEWIETLKA